MRTLGSLLFIGWHTGVGFLIGTEGFYDEGGATDPLRGTAGGDAEGGRVDQCDSF